MMPSHPTCSSSAPFPVLLNDGHPCLAPVPFISQRSASLTFPDDAITPKALKPCTLLAAKLDQLVAHKGFTGSAKTVGAAAKTTGWLEQLRGKVRVKGVACPQGW